ncbi:MAG: DUF4783 domain-containing protein [Bacteroidetes bacterium]|nr:DUF4783 domain-containing protein [Bacteroidota bacterium]
MKNLLFVLLLVPAVMWANQGNPSLETISAALNTGDVETLSKYFADNVEISIQDKEQVYRKADAADVLRNFFTANKAKNFSQVHKGASRENSDQYCIGNLSAGNNNYRVYLYLKVSGANMFIQEIRLDKE